MTDNTHATARQEQIDNPENVVVSCVLYATGSVVGMPLTMMSSREEETLRFFEYVEDSGLRVYSGVVTRDLVWNEKSRSVPEKNDKKRKQEEVVKRFVNITLPLFRLGLDSVTSRRHYIRMCVRERFTFRLQVASLSYGRNCVISIILVLESTFISLASPC